MNSERVCEYIVKWLRDRIREAGQKGFVVGVSGGVDSAVTSTLCAKTGLPLLCVNMPILQVESQFERAEMQIRWLCKEFRNVSGHTVDLSNVFTGLQAILPEQARSDSASVNCRSRLRMVTLYAFANANDYVVCGTGNKVEDHGIGFFTKYGDGGVDISPIGGLLKSEVYGLARLLEVPEAIQNAAPTDGLWDIDRTDEEQIGATYDDIEWAMDYCDDNAVESENDLERLGDLGQDRLKVLRLYLERHIGSRHKMETPPTCDVEAVKG